MMPVAANLTNLAGRTAEEGAAGAPVAAELFAALLAGTGGRDGMPAAPSSGTEERGGDQAPTRDDGAVPDAAVLLPMLDQQSALVPAARFVAAATAPASIGAGPHAQSLGTVTAAAALATPVIDPAPAPQAPAPLPVAGVVRGAAQVGAESPTPVPIGAGQHAQPLGTRAIAAAVIAPDGAPAPRASAPLPIAAVDRGAARVSAASTTPVSIGAGQQAQPLGTVTGLAAPSMDPAPAPQASAPLSSAGITGGAAQVRPESATPVPAGAGQHAQPVGIRTAATTLAAPSIDPAPAPLAFASPPATAVVGGAARGSGPAAAPISGAGASPLSSPTSSFDPSASVRIGAPAQDPEVALTFRAVTPAALAGVAASTAPAPATAPIAAAPASAVAPAAGAAPGSAASINSPAASGAVTAAAPVAAAPASAVASAAGGASGSAGPTDSPAATGPVAATMVAAPALPAAAASARPGGVAEGAPQAIVATPSAAAGAPVSAAAPLARHPDPRIEIAASAEVAVAETAVEDAPQAAAPAAVMASDRAAASVAAPVLAASAPGGPAPAQPLAAAIAAQVLDLARGSGWIDELAQDIARTTSADATLRFRLNPETLGDLRVEITQSERGAHIRLQVASEAAQQVLAEAQPRLTAEARAQGVRVAETEISFTGGQAQERDSGRGHEAPAEHARRSPASRSAPSITINAMSEAPGATAQRRTDRYA